MKDDRLYLTHILECIAKIERFTREGEQAFLSDDKTQDAVLRNLQIMAESTQRLSKPSKASHPEVPWTEIAGFRKVAREGLPQLKQAGQAMLAALPNP